jgi:hypothetical protein
LVIFFMTGRSKRSVEQREGASEQWWGVLLPQLLSLG